MGLIKFNFKLKLTRCSLPFPLYNVLQQHSCRLLRAMCWPVKNNISVVEYHFWNAAIYSSLGKHRLYHIASYRRDKINHLFDGWYVVISNWPLFNLIMKLLVVVTSFTTKIVKLVISDSMSFVHKICHIFDIVSVPGHHSFAWKTHSNYFPGDIS